MDEKAQQEFTLRPTGQAQGDGDTEQRMEGAARKTLQRGKWPEPAMG